MNYERAIFDDICKNIGKKPILVLYGARQVGKTTLVKSIMAKFKNPLYLQGDDPKDAILIEGRSGKELANGRLHFTAFLPARFAIVWKRSLKCLSISITDSKND